MIFRISVLSDQTWFNAIYAVTTTGQAITALKMLRENRDKFDLVISDVHMPDMDGFKLLELVGLEMDLPVISKPLTEGFVNFLFFPSSVIIAYDWSSVIEIKNAETLSSTNWNSQIFLETCAIFYLYSSLVEGIGSLPRLSKCTVLTPLRCWIRYMWGPCFGNRKSLTIDLTAKMLNGDDPEENS